MVLDPFCGTGSIALACQHFRAFVIGSDLDMRVLKGYAVGGRTRNKGIEGIERIERFDVFANFQHYGLARPDFLAADISALCFNLGQDEQEIGVRPVFDAIVCDPPYGVRARSQKVGVRDSKKDREVKASTNPDGD